MGIRYGILMNGSSSGCPDLQRAGGRCNPVCGGREYTREMRVEIMARS
jgi:hypothetical protein